MSAPDRNRIGRYVVIDVPWRGGRGLVYRAWDRQFIRQLAIKTLTDGFTDDEEMLKRFYQETTKTGALRHPNIVTGYDPAEQDGFPCIVHLSEDPPVRQCAPGFKGLR